MTEKGDSSPGQSEQNEIFRALERSRKEARLWKNRYENVVSGKKQDESATNRAPPVINQPDISDKAPKSDHDGRLKPWQAACATCGEKNPEYKPETACDNCTGTLGTVEVAKKLDFCPHCGQKAKFRALTAEAKQKVAEMIRS